MMKKLLVAINISWTLTFWITPIIVPIINHNNYLLNQDGQRFIFSINAGCRFIDGRFIVGSLMQAVKNLGVDCQVSAVSVGSL